MQKLILIIITMTTVFSLDMVWLRFLSKQIYAENIGVLLRKSAEGIEPIWSAAFVVYALMAIGLVYFVLPKASGNYWQALISGVCFGLVTYGIYDFTNYAILENWTFKITIIDLLWGMVLCGLSSVIVTFIQNRFL